MSNSTEEEGGTANFTSVDSVLTPDKWTLPLWILALQEEMIILKQTRSREIIDLLILIFVVLTLVKMYTT